LAICDNAGNIVAPLTVQPVNKHDTELLPESFLNFLEIADLLGLELSGVPLTLDAGFDSEPNRVMIRRYELRPVIKLNPRNTRDPDKLAALAEQAEADQPIYCQRYKVERCFAWEDVYRKLVIRYERLQSTHLGFKYLAYSMINLRWFIGKK
jgi:transposase